MSHKVITVEIIAFDGFEAEGINDAIGSILEREDWRVYAWYTDDATDTQKEWFKEAERDMVRAEQMRAAVHFDPRIDYPERYREGPI